MEEGIQTAIDELGGVSQADATVIVTDHAKVDYQMIVERSQLVVDTRNSLRGVVAANIVRL